MREDKIYFSGSLPTVVKLHAHPDIVFRDRVIFVEPGSQLDMRLRGLGCIEIKKHDFRWPIIRHERSFTRQIAAQYGFTSDAQ